MQRMLLTLAMAGLLLSCQPESGTPSSLSNSDSARILSTPGANTLRIVNAQQIPLSGAQILIGTELNAPFTENFLTTDAQGEVEIPSDWISPASVTVQAPGYVRSTYFHQSPGALTFVLRKQTQSAAIEISGVTTGLPIVDRDGDADFGMVMPSFVRMDLLSFSLNNIISPHNDSITAVGQTMDIPANISLPKQTERYSIISVTLDKPKYRLYTDVTGPHRLFAARGKFPFKSTADALRGGASFLDLINDFQISGGAVRDLHVGANSISLNLPTTELHFTEKVSVTAPVFRADETYIVASIADQSGFMIPTDFKRLKSSQKASLGMLPNSSKMLLGVLMRAEDFKNSIDRMSVALTPMTSAAPNLLPLISEPTVLQNEILLPPLNSEPGIYPLATLLVLSKEEDVLQGGATVKVFAPKWEIYGNSWLTRIELPKWPNEPSLPGKKRWEVNFIGSQTASQVPPGPAMIEAATHVTHSSISF